MSHLVLKIVARLHEILFPFCLVPIFGDLFVLFYQPEYQFNSVPEILEKGKTPATGTNNQEGHLILTSELSDPITPAWVTFNLERRVEVHP